MLAARMVAAGHVVFGRNVYPAAAAANVIGVQKPGGWKLQASTRAA
jgi:hypothetical protein